MQEGESTKGTEGDAPPVATNAEPVAAAPAPSPPVDAPPVAAAAEPSPPVDPPPAAAAPAPEPEPESVVEVEPEPSRPTSQMPKVPTHLPPPPPSIRAKGGSPNLERLAVPGDPKLAQDLMTKKLFTIGPTDVIAHLEEHMQAFRFRHLPVVEDRKLVGLISHEDLLRVSPSLFSAKAKLQDELIHQLPAKHVMQTKLVTVRPGDTLEHVAVMMWEEKAGCVFVTEADGTLLGIITEGDFIRLAHHFLTHPRG